MITKINKKGFKQKKQREPRRAVKRSVMTRWERVAKKMGGRETMASHLVTAQVGKLSTIMNALAGLCTESMENGITGWCDTHYPETLAA